MTQSSYHLLKHSQPAKLSNTLVLTATMIAISLVTGCTNNTADTHIVNNTNSKAAASESANVSANHADNDSDVVAMLQSNLKASGINETITSAVPTDMPNIYWVTADGVPSFFTDKEGKYIIQGQIVQIGDEQPVDISSDLIARSAKDKLAAVDKKDMVIFPAKGPTKGVIYAFTDADCGYCRKLHSQIDKTNELGIEVRYLAWPRSEQTVPIMEAIWCSADRNAAMNTAKSGGQVTAKQCINPVKQQVALGHSLGVRGTPAIFTQDGQQIGGYLPPKQIAQALDIH